MEKTALETILEVLAVFLIGVLFVLGQMVLSGFLQERISKESVLGEAQKEAEFVYLIEDQDKYVDIVNEANNIPVVDPQVVFDTGAFSNDPQETEGTLGTPTESVRAYNPTSDEIFTVALAPVIDVGLGETFADVVWHNGAPLPGDEKSFPIQSMQAEDGRLSAIFNDAVISSDVGCTLDGTSIMKGDNAYYLHDPVDSGNNVESIDLILASGVVTYCRWDIQGIVMHQWVPANQAVDAYGLDMIITIT